MRGPTTFIALLCALLSLAASPASAAAQIDATPRVVVLSAFAPEMKALLATTKTNTVKRVNGIAIHLGTIGGKKVAVLESGVSMVNAAMAAQLVIDRLNVTAIVFSGIAGGVNPALHIGDVAVPQKWGQYLEAVFARKTKDGYKPPPFKKTPFPNFGMIFPSNVTVRSAAHPDGLNRFWFPVDAKLLAVANSMSGHLKLTDCAKAKCLDKAPRLVVGGNGVSGQAFVDNAAFRAFAFKTFHANVLDMETAAVAAVAYANDVPFIGFRSLSDLAGGGPGENEMAAFMGVAATNAAHVLRAFLKAMPEK